MDGRTTTVRVTVAHETIPTAASRLTAKAHHRTVEATHPRSGVPSACVCVSGSSFSLFTGPASRRTRNRANRPLPTAGHQMAAAPVRMALIVAPMEPRTHELVHALEQLLMPSPPLSFGRRRRVCEAPRRQHEVAGQEVMRFDDLLLAPAQRARLELGQATQHFH